MEQSENKAVLITGAAGGLGSALARQLAEQGATLILLDKDENGLGRLSDEIVDAGHEAPWLHPLDLSVAGVEAFDDLRTALTSSFGALDVIVHCAADFKGLQLMEQVDPQQWLECIQVNVNAPWLLTCTCLPLLKASARAVVLFLLEDLDRVTGGYWGPYGTSKAALAGMVRQFDEALSHTTVRVRGVYPGAMRTALRARAYHAEDPSSVPSPERAARRVIALLSEGGPDSGPVVDLSKS